MNVAQLKPSKKTMLKAAGVAKNSGVIEKLQAARGNGDEESQDGVGDGRRMPIQQAVDVAVPLETVWKLWNKYEDYPKFMHRIESAEKLDAKHVKFTSKIWGIRRSWEAEITEKRTNEVISFSSDDGLEIAGTVTFHRLSPRLTHVELNLDMAPHGPLEKVARGGRFAKRAVRADLHRFKAYAEMNEG